MQRDELIALGAATHADLTRAAEVGVLLHASIGGEIPDPDADLNVFTDVARWWRAGEPGSPSASDRLLEAIALIAVRLGDNFLHDAQVELGALAGEAKGHYVNAQPWQGHDGTAWGSLADEFGRALQSGLGGLECLQAQTGNWRRFLKRHSATHPVV